MKILLWSCLVAFSISTCIAEKINKAEKKWLKETPNQLSLSDDQDYSDLESFTKAIGDKRIVLLDELTHGEKEVLQLKSRLVRYLHQEKGFEVLMLESGMFDVNRIWQTKNKSINQQAPGNIFYMYSNSHDVQGLFDYIDGSRNSKVPLQLTGFDGRLSGNYSLTQAIAFIQKETASLFSSSIVQQQNTGYFKLSQQVLFGQASGLSEEQKNRYISNSYQLIDQLQGVNSKDKKQRAKYVSQLIKGILFKAEVQWGSRRHDEHDIVMAENIEWMLSNQFSGKKVIIWGHYIHLNRNGAEINRYANVGTELNSRFKDELYIAHFSAVKGQYRKFDDMSMQDLKPLANKQFESQLGQAYSLDQECDCALFINQSSINREATNDSSMYGHEYLYTIPVHQWKNHWDGMFLISKISPSEK